MKKIIECVPNFSEGRDLAVIKQITDAISSVDGVSLLDVDPGASTNRTVVTLVGAPEPVIEAAFRGFAKAAELIDMSKHSGAHPRMGATDVCPLIPIANVSDEEAIEYAHKLAKRVGEELNIPIYLYEKAATRPDRQNLAKIRAGEYEAFAEKIYTADFKPDYGPQEFNAKSGQSVIGVRGFLIAYNVNLNTQSEKRANSIAFDVREKGRAKREKGKKVMGADGKPVMEPGKLKSVKGIGWYVEEYGIAQVSMNLTNISITPLHEAFDACVESAYNRGMRVTGSELVGLLPKKCLIDAGKYFLKKQNRSLGISESELIHIAIKSMGLDELKPFDPKEKVIEYAIEEANSQKLVNLSVKDFNDLTASEAPAPGGGSVSALCAALGASLGGMVANLSANKAGWNYRVGEFSPWAEKAQALKDELLYLIDADTEAFNLVLEAMRMPKGSKAEKAARGAAIEAANKGAAQIPFRIMETAFQSYELLMEMAQNGLAASITDAGVGALCTHTGIVGAGLNVRINLGGIKDEAFKTEMREAVARISAESAEQQAAIMAVVETKM